MVDVFAGYSIVWAKKNANNKPTDADAGVLKKDGTAMDIYAENPDGTVNTEGLAWKHYDATAQKNVYEKISVATGVPTIAGKLQLVDSYKNITTATAATYITGKYWEANAAATYTFGTISTAETTATVKFPYETTWKYKRTYTLSVKIVD